MMVAKLACIFTFSLSSHYSIKGQLRSCYLILGCDCGLQGTFGVMKKREHDKRIADTGLGTFCDVCVEGCHCAQRSHACE